MSSGIPGAGHLIPDIPWQHYDFVRAKDYRGAFGIRFVTPALPTQLKPGDRILGFLNVTCDDCVQVRSYWVYFQQGQGGWFAETSPDYAVQLAKVEEIIKSQGPDALLSSIAPQNHRTPIERAYVAPQ